MAELAFSPAPRDVRRPGHQDEDVPFWEEDGYVEMAGEGELRHRSEMVTGPLEPQASAPSAPRRNSMPGLTVARRPSAASERARPSPSSPSSPQPDSKSLDSSIASSFDVWTPQTAAPAQPQSRGNTAVLRGLPQLPQLLVALEYPGCTPFNSRIAVGPEDASCTLAAHQSVLAARSPVLAAMFRHKAFQEGQTAKVRLVDVDVETFKQYLHLLYTGDLEEGLNLDHILEVLVIADRFQSPGFGDVLARRLRDLVTWDETVGKVMMTYVRLPEDSEYSGSLVGVMGDQLTQLSFKDALRQTQKAVLQPIDEDTSRLKAIAARGLIFSMLAFPIMRDIADEAVNKRIVCLLSLITDTFGSLCELPDEPRSRDEVLGAAASEKKRRKRRSGRRFSEVLWIRTGFDLSRAWALLDPSNRQALTLPEFVRGCRELGFDGDAVHIFKGSRCLARAWEELPRMETLRASDAVLQKIRVLLRHLDKDRTGTVSQRQFEWLLRSNLPAVEAVSREDLDHMWSTFAKRADGDIEYEDLIQWILKPSTPLTVSSTWELTFFDLKSHLEPLFWAYDQDRDGIINWEEFMETHGVLQNALRLNPSLEGDTDPAMIKGDLHHCYLTMIGSEGDKRLTFARFITWQRDALMSSSLPSDVLAKTLRSVAKQLQRVFKLSEIEKRGQLTESDKQVLVRILQHLAQFSRELWGQSGYQRDAVVAHSFANKWTAPVVGMNVQQLKAVFLHDFDRSRLKFSSRVTLNKWEIFCIPAIPIPHRLPAWLARVRLMTELKDGRKLSSGFHVYRYQQEFFTWHLISDSTAGTAFEVALEGLSAELRLFCLLKTLANFGVRLPWPNLQEALSQAVGMQIVTEEQRRLCLSAFEEQVAKGLHAEGLYFSRERLEKVTGLVTSPSHVMGIFVESSAFSLDHQGLGRLSRTDFEYLQQVSSCSAQGMSIELRMLRSWAAEVCSDSIDLLLRLKMIGDHAGGWAQVLEPIEPSEFARRLEVLGFPGEPAEIAAEVARCRGNGAASQISVEHVCCALFGLKQFRRATGTAKDAVKTKTLTTAAARKKNPIRKAEWDSSIFSGFCANASRPASLRVYFSSPQKDPVMHRAASNPTLSRPATAVATGPMGPSANKGGSAQDRRGRSASPPRERLPRRACPLKAAGSADTPGHALRAPRSQGASRRAESPILRARQPCLKQGRASGKPARARGPSPRSHQKGRSAEQCRPRRYHDHDGRDHG
ncbi:spop [Symbiodinium sp. CCMP2456]|nr:spop [Symbiodinium sp. CCMP2456]